MAKTKLPFCTSNRSLAIALHLGGCRIIGYWRAYTPHELISLGLTADQAARQDRGGNDCFFIEDNEERESLEKAFDETAKAVKQEVAVDVSTVSNADAVRIACMASKLRGDIQSMRRNPVFARVVEAKGAPTMKDLESGERVLSHPGFKITAAKK